MEAVSVHGIVPNMFVIQLVTIAINCFKLTAVILEKTNFASKPFTVYK